jgi:glycerophosphoryl diester phosphodiesterase
MLNEALQSKRIIVHAGGSLDGNTYLNSIDGIKKYYNDGYRIFEVDVAYTSDKKLILSHNRDTVQTLEEFLSYKICGWYTPTSFSALVEFMEEHRDVLILLDFWDCSPEELRERYSVIIAECKNCDDVLERFIAGGHTTEGISIVRSIYNFKYVNLYMPSKKEVKELYGDFDGFFNVCITAKISSFSTSVKKFNALEEEERLKLLGLGIHSFLFTENNPQLIKKYLNYGISAIGSDLLRDPTTGENELILYNIADPKTIGTMLEHRLSTNSDKKAVIAVDANVYKTRRFDVNILSNFVRNGIFSNFILCNEWAGRNPVNTTISEIENSIVKQFTADFANFGYSIEDFDEVYDTCDMLQGEFGIFCSIMNVKTFWIEIGINLAFSHSRESYIRKKMPKLTPDNREAYIEVHLKHCATYPGGKLVTPILSPDSPKSIELLQNKTLILWSSSKSFSSISDSTIEKVIACFGVYDLPNNGQTLLNRQSENFGYTHRNSELLNDVRFGLYRDLRNSHLKALYSELIALDFYAPPDKRLYIKSHPSQYLSSNDAVNNYGEHTNVLSQVPADFLYSYYAKNNVKFNTIIGFGSRSNTFIASENADLIILTTNWWRSFFLYPELFAALTFLNEIALNSVVFCSSLILEQCQLLSEKVVLSKLPVILKNQIKAFTKRNSYIVDNVDLYENIEELLLSASENATVVFLNIRENFMIANPELLRFLYPIKITKEATREDTLDPLRSETMWLFSKNDKILNNAKNFTLERKLSRTGLLFKVNKLSVSEYIDELDRIELYSK